MALERGVETIHEIVLYTVVLGIPLWEMNKSSNDAKAKEQKLQEKLDNLEKLSNQAEVQLSSLTKNKYLILWILT